MVFSFPKGSWKWEFERYMRAVTILQRARIMVDKAYNNYVIVCKLGFTKLRATLVSLQRGRGQGQTRTSFTIDSYNLQNIGEAPGPPVRVN